MQQHRSLAEPHQIVPQPYWVAPDSIGTVSDSAPIHPEDKHPLFEDFKQKKRKPHSEHPPEEPNGKHPDPDHQIDEYA